MTEHAAVIFVFFFLAEYASIVIMCIFTSVLFLGGYLFKLDDILYILEICKNLSYSLNFNYNNFTTLGDTNFVIEKLSIPFYLKGFIYSIILGIKTSIMVFIFI
jgi:NADH-ubiquinone oxidoreductase chain 1